MLRRLFAALFVGLTFMCFSGLNAEACQMPPGLSRRVIKDAPPFDPDAAVVLEVVAERWQPAFESGREVGRALYSKVIRVIKGDPGLTQIVQFSGNGECGGGGPIGISGFFFGYQDSREWIGDLKLEGGQQSFFGEWFSPAQASEFSWIRNHAPPKGKIIPPR